MDVSVESNPAATAAAVGSQCLPPPPPSPTHSRKRAFSEVDEPNNNVSVTQETHKYPKKHDNDSDDQENRNPLQAEHMDMVVDKPAVVMASNSNSHSMVSAAANVTGNVNTATNESSIAPTPQSVTPQQPPSTTVATVKKQKLSPNSKEAKRLEKEERERLRLEEKARKEEEKRLKEEERKRKEAEREEEKRKREAEREEERKRREEKRKAKEEERLARDEEKRRKEEEKVKKERSQMRLSSFFAKPASDANKPPSVGGSSPRKDSDKDSESAIAATASTAKEHRSDYHNEFPDFFIQSHTQLAPQHRFQRDDKAIEHIREKLDGYLKETGAFPLYRPSELFNMIPYRRHKGRNVKPVKELIKELQYDINDHTGSKPGPLDTLRKITMKSLKFAEDVRPPYYGTFTKPLTSEQAGKLCRRPHSRTLPETNYDYDSEAEWEEPEEGEDLDSEGEEEMSEDGYDDMEGFLDDDDEQIDGRRRLVVGDLEPVCTGIHWQDEGDKNPLLEAHRMETISDTIQFPIDPFSTAYWPKPKAVEQVVSKGHATTTARNTLHAFSTNPIAQSQAPTAPIARPGMGIDSAGASKKGKPFPPDQLAAFKETIEGSDLTKAGLIEVLKKRFPKISKDTLKDTLNEVAVRVGQKEADKKWVCK